MAVRAEYNYPDAVKSTHYEFPVFQITDRDTDTDPYTPIDLTGSEVKAVFRYGDMAGPECLSVDTTSGITITDATNGKFQIDTLQVNIPVGTYYYDIKTIISGVHKIHVYGTWNVLQNSTD